MPLIRVESNTKELLERICMTYGCDSMNETILKLIDLRINPELGIDFKQTWVPNPKFLVPEDFPIGEFVLPDKNFDVIYVAIPLTETIKGEWFSLMLEQALEAIKAKSKEYNYTSPVFGIRITKYASDKNLESHTIGKFSPIIKNQMIVLYSIYPKESKI